jgi:hypothetical protein
MITLAREEAQRIEQYTKPGALVPVDMQTTQLLVNALRARLAQPETSYETGQRLYREGKGISFIPTAVERDDQIGEALRGFEAARLSAPEPEPVALAWAEGYKAGIEDERSSEANIGIAGFGAKVEPARQNPYAAPPQREWQGLTEHEKALVMRRSINRRDAVTLTETMLREKNT